MLALALGIRQGGWVLCSEAGTYVLTLAAARLVNPELPQSHLHARRLGT